MYLILHHLDAIGLTFEVEISRDWFEVLQLYLAAFYRALCTPDWVTGCWVTAVMYDLSISSVVFLSTGVMWLPC